MQCPRIAQFCLLLPGFPNAAPFGVLEQRGLAQHTSPRSHPLSAIQEPLQAGGVEAPAPIISKVQVHEGSKEKDIAGGPQEHEDATALQVPEAPKGCFEDRSGDRRANRLDLASACLTLSLTLTQP